MYKHQPLSKCFRYSSGNGPPSPLLDFGFSFPGVPFMGGGGGAAPVAPAPPQPEATPAPPPPEPTEDKDARKMTYEHLMFHLEKLESLFPDIPPDQMAHKLRMLVERYDSTLWKLMLNVNSPVPFAGRDIAGFTQGPENKPTFDLLRSMMEHGVKGGAETGVVKIGGDTVALGNAETTHMSGQRKM